MMLSPSDYYKSNVNYLLFLLILPSLYDIYQYYNYPYLNYKELLYEISNIQGYGKLLYLIYPQIIIQKGLLLWIILIGILKISKI